jgi:hypothetical protein
VGGRLSHCDKDLNPKLETPTRIVRNAGILCSDSEGIDKKKQNPYIEIQLRVVYFIATLIDWREVI